MASAPLPGVEVLVVDDNASVRLALRLALEFGGYTVFEADNGQPALARLRTHPRGMVVLCDWHMPGMDGEALLRAVAADGALARRHVYVLMTASEPRTLPPSFAHTLTRVGAQILPKSFDINHLLAAIVQAVTRLPRTA